MAQPETPVYMVDATCDPAAVKIAGRACFQNSASLRDFFTSLIKTGRRNFAVDFGGCASMDSTFLGVLAGTALELRRLDPPGSVVLCNIGARNLELVRNLGLHRIMTIDANGECGKGASLAARTGSLVPGRAFPYALDQGERTRCEPGASCGAGGLLCSVRDLARWGEELATGRRLGRALVERMRETGHLADGSSLDYAAGLTGQGQRFEEYMKTVPAEPGGPARAGTRSE